MIAALVLVAAMQDAAPAPGSRQAIGQAPIVAGNQVGARDRALGDALRQLVDQALGEILEPAVRAANDKPLRAIYARPRTYVRRYRVLDQGEAAGVWRMQIEGEVDLPTLRRDVERALPPAVAPPVGAAPEIVLVVAGAAADEPTIAAALASAGVKARAPKPGEPPPASALGASVVAKGEGAVRGTGKTAFVCAIEARGGPAGVAASVTTRGFAVTEGAARADCVSRAAADLAARIGPELAPPTVASATGGRVVTVDADLIEPGAVASLLKLLRNLAVVSSAELRRLAAGRAEIRVTTRQAAATLAAAVQRDAAPALALTDVRVAGDLIQLRARALGAPPPPSQAPSQPPAPFPSTPPTSVPTASTPR